MWNGTHVECPFCKKRKSEKGGKMLFEKKNLCLWTNYNNNKLFIIIIFNNLIVINFGRENLFDPSSNYKEE